MPILKTFRLKRWETGLFKCGMLALGMMIGALWPNFFDGFFPLLLAIAILTLSYITYIWWKQ